MCVVVLLANHTARVFATSPIAEIRLGAIIDETLTRDVTGSSSFSVQYRLPSVGQNRSSSRVSTAHFGPNARHLYGRNCERPTVVRPRDSAVSLVKTDSVSTRPAVAMVPLRIDSYNTFSYNVLLVDILTTGDYRFGWPCIGCIPRFRTIVRNLVRGRTRLFVIAVGKVVSGCPFDFPPAHCICIHLLWNRPRSVLFLRYECVFRARVRILSTTLTGVWLPRTPCTRSL